MITAQKRIRKQSIPNVNKKGKCAQKDRHKTKKASSISIDSISIAAKKRFAPTTHVYHEEVESTCNSKKNRPSQEKTRKRHTVMHARAKQTVIKESPPKLNSPRRHQATRDTSTRL